MIKFEVAYIPEHNGLSISATIGNDIGSTAFIVPENLGKHASDLSVLADMLQVSMNQLINGKRTAIENGIASMVEPLSKGLAL